MTTIARVACPFVPKFWRWHSLPLPRLVPREEQLLDGAGLFARAGRLQFILYTLAYVAGAWFALREVWERR